jgi:hypothetical protein
MKTNLTMEKTWMIDEVLSKIQHQLSELIKMGLIWTTDLFL